MINIRTIKKLKEDEGLTLKGGKIINYKSGWQVATEGIETKDPRIAIQKVKEFCGNCGLWYSQGVYYVDRSHRESTKREALAVGRRCNQISIYGWASGKLAYC